MTWSSSLNHWRNCTRSWSSGRTSGQHGQNQGPDIWAEAWCASEAWKRPLWRMSQWRWHKFYFLWWLFQLNPQEMQWHPWPSEAWCQLQVWTVYWIGQTNRLQIMTEVTVGWEKLEVLPSFCYLEDCLSSGGGCELISHHLQRKSLQIVCQECHAPCKRNLGPNLIWLALPAMQWPSYDLLDVWCYHQGPSQLAAYPEHRVSPQPSYPAPHSWHGHPHDPNGLCHGWLLPD